MFYRERLSSSRVNGNGSLAFDGSLLATVVGKNGRCFLEARTPAAAGYTMSPGDALVFIPEISEDPVARLSQRLELGGYDRLGHGLLKDNIGLPATSLASLCGLTMEAPDSSWAAHILITESKDG